MRILHLSKRERKAFQRVKDLLEDYPHIDEYIKERESLLLCPYYEDNDENVGGGKALNKKDNQVERLAISIADDKYLTNLHKNKDAISECLKKTDDTTRRIIEELYFKQELTVTGVAHREHLSISQVGRKRNKFLEKLGKKLGLL